MDSSDHFYAVILAGGGGTRLWPKSRKSTPKHLLKLYGDRTMLQQTFNRIVPLIPKERIYLITLQDYVPAVIHQLPTLPKENIIAEPMGKNTALAMGVASAYVQKRDSQAVIINLAADQLIENEEKFRQIALDALNVASQEGHIVAIGIKPTFAHTGLGYIKIGDELEQFRDSKSDVYVFKCRGFKEKPDLTTAQSFLASGQYLWNANLYCWSVQTIAEAMKDHSPQIGRGVEKVFETIGSQNEDSVLKDVYEDAENVQIDVAVSEKAKNLVVIPGDFGWNDVGDWKVIYDTQKKDGDGNVLVTKSGEFVGIGTKDCLIETNGRLIATIGVENIVVVDTPDALLVCHKNRTQDVKKVVEKLKADSKTKYL